MNKFRTKTGTLDIQLTNVIRTCILLPGQANWSPWWLYRPHCSCSSTRESCTPSWKRWRWSCSRRKCSQASVSDFHSPPIEPWVSVTLHRSDYLLITAENVCFLTQHTELPMAFFRVSKVWSYSRPPTYQENNTKLLDKITTENVRIT